MSQFPSGGLLGRLRSLLSGIRKLNLPVHAANTGYFLILSLFPGLVLLLGTLRYAQLSIHSLLSLLEGLIPAALLPDAELLIVSAYQNTSRTVVGISAAAALWSASRGVYGLLTGLNAVYGVQESRGYLRTRLLSVLYTFGFLVVLLLTLLLHVFGTHIAALLNDSQVPFLRFLTGIIDLRLFLLLGLQTALFWAIFTVLPNRHSRPGDSLPGALLATIGWMIFSHLFSVYVEHFPSYTAVYGSVYAVALSMLWLYFCILILFYGGLLNRLLSGPPLEI